METILITGGTGLIGKQLSNLLREEGYKIAILSRTNSDDPNRYYWDIEKNFIEPNAIKNADYIVHLAGAGIADKRWTKKRKKELVNSRINSTKLLYKNVVKHNPNLKGFIAASGIGYYGAVTLDKTFTENDAVGSDFVATICKLWEKESMKFNKINIRTVIFRTGIVISKTGGALEKISKPIKMGVGAPIATGNQFMPWIHINDLCAMYLHAIENNEIHGIYNAVAPEHITNKELTLITANHFKKSLFMPNIPKQVFQLYFGELSGILTEGSKVSSNKIIKAGFKFETPNFNDALNN